jgi:hypothetical protein
MDSELNGILAGAHICADASEAEVSDLKRAEAMLEKRLREDYGVVSVIALCRAFATEGISSELLNELKFYDFEDSEQPRWRYHGRSFYSEERYQRTLREQEERAERAAQQPDSGADATEEPSARHKRRQEEARLGSYVVTALESIYDSTFGPDGGEAPYAFDVHNERAGGKFENVDAIAIDWRRDDVADLVTVEVKLAFTNDLVQQARNYCRFSHRVWIAVPVSGPPLNAAEHLREQNKLLFDHVIDSGLGILACRPGRGRSYDVFPVHWPRKLTPDTVELQQFIDRYRGLFEQACVVRPSGRQQYPFK